MVTSRFFYFLAVEFRQQQFLLSFTGRFASCFVLPAAVVNPLFDGFQQWSSLSCIVSMYSHTWIKNLRLITITASSRSSTCFSGNWRLLVLSVNVKCCFLQHLWQKLLGRCWVVSPRARSHETRWWCFSCLCAHFFYFSFDFDSTLEQFKKNKQVERQTILSFLRVEIYFTSREVPLIACGDNSSVNSSWEWENSWLQPGY